MNQEEVRALLERVRAILEGHFVLTSRRHAGNYVNKDAVNPHVHTVSDLCRAIAFQFSTLDIDVVAAPAVGGIALGSWTAHHLSNGREVLSVYAEHEEHSLAKAKATDVQVASHGVLLLPGEELLVRSPRMIFKRGHDELLRGKRVLVVEDIVTTGGSAKSVVEAAQAAGATIVGVAVLCNRGKITASEVGLTSGEKFIALLDLDLPSYTEKECPFCVAGVPVNTNVGKGKAYLAEKAAAQA